MVGKRHRPTRPPSSTLVLPPVVVRKTRPRARRHACDSLNTEEASRQLLFQEGLSLSLSCTGRQPVRCKQSDVGGERGMLAPCGQPSRRNPGRRRLPSNGVPYPSPTRIVKGRTDRSYRRPPLSSPPRICLAHPTRRPLGSVNDRQADVEQRCL